jgi:hypothetical protein
MTKWGRTAGAATLVLLGAAIGCLAAFVHLVPPLVEGTQRTNLLWLQSEAYARYRFGQYASAKRALLLHAQLAEATAAQAEPDRRRHLLAESGMAYARLAVLAERADKGRERDEFYSKSLSQYASLGDTVTREQLRELVAGYDHSWDTDFRDAR